MNIQYIKTAYGIQTSRVNKSDLTALGTEKILTAARGWHTTVREPEGNTSHLNRAAAGRRLFRLRVGLKAEFD